MSESIRAVLGTAADAEAVIDVQRLIGTHMCIQGNAGAGKSGAIRKLLEITHGRLQHIVFDVEDEFYTLRERFDYVIAGGDNGDCAATVEGAPQLVLTLLEHGLSAIIQINTLPLEVRRAFVRAALEALIGAPRELWHPALIVLDEADRYCPQDGRVESSAAVTALMDQGRKRGFTGVLATQRLAKIDKDATGSVNNWLMGRVGQMVDRKAVADALGFGAKSEEGIGLQRLVTRQFWGFGPAIAPTPVLITIGATETTILRAGQAKVPTPPPADAMRGILAALTAAAAAPTEQAEGKNAPENITRNITPDPKAIAEAEQRGYERGHEAAASWANLALTGARDRLRETLRLIEGEVEKAPADKIAARPIPQESAVPRSQPAPKPPRPSTPSPVASEDGTIPALTGPQRHLLQGLAWWRAMGHSEPTRTQLAGIAGWTPKGSNLRNRLAELSTAGLIEYPRTGLVRLTPAGVAAAPNPDVSHTLMASVRTILTGPQQALFDFLLDRREAVSRSELAEAVGWEPGGSNLRNRLAELSSLELVEYPSKGAVVLRPWLLEAA